MSLAPNEVLAIKMTKSGLFDGVLHKQATFSARKFPAHFHQEFSVAFIEQGSERLVTAGQDALLPAGSLVVLPPGVVHAHEGASHWRYQSFYLRKEVVDFVLRPYGQNADAWRERAYFHFSAGQIMAELFKKTLESVENEQVFGQNVARLFSFFQSTKPHEPRIFGPIDRERMNSIQIFLEKNMGEKVSLEAMCQRFKLEKFNLLRQFKRHTGLTPIQYLLALRIESVKKALETEQPLSEIAFETGFYDSSHFNHCFQKYVGTSPSQYRFGLLK